MHSFAYTNSNPSIYQVKLLYYYAHFTDHEM